MVGIRSQAVPQRADKELQRFLVDAVEEQLDGDAEGDGQEHSCSQRLVQNADVAIPVPAPRSGFRASTHMYIFTNFKTLKTQRLVQNAGSAVPALALCPGFHAWLRRQLRAVDGVTSSASVRHASMKRFALKRVLTAQGAIHLSMRAPEKVRKFQMSKYAV